MEKLSVIITTYNEAKHIGALLDTLRWVDECIVVDSFSTDETPQIAQQYSNVTFLQRPYINPADQKNWAIQQVSYDWILLFDADERPTPELIQEIQSLLNHSTSTTNDAFWIKRQNHFMGQPVHYSGWQGDSVIRLFKKHCKYEEKWVHEEIDTSNISVGKLSSKMLHFTYTDLEHFLSKMHRYARWAAKDYLHSTPKINFYHLCFKPFFRFFKHFILQKGFLDGKVGFIISAIMAWGVFLRYAKIQELHMKTKKED